MRIGIYGLGRFGSFWAELCSHLGTVCAFNRSQRPVPAGVEMVDLAGLTDCDVIFLCCAISAMPAVCAGLAPLLKPGCLVMDTCSVKVWPVQQMLSAFPPEIEIIGSHPMFGPDSARDGVVGLPMVLSPVRSSAERFQHWFQIFAGLGLRTISMTPDEHDREAARTQGVTHFMGRIFAELGLRPSAIATVGYNRLTEVMEQTCNDPWQLFVDLQYYNPHTAAMRADVLDAINHLSRRLEADRPIGAADPRLTGETLR